MRRESIWTFSSTQANTSRVSLADLLLHVLPEPSSTKDPPTSLDGPSCSSFSVSSLLLLVLLPSPQAARSCKISKRSPTIKPDNQTNQSDQTSKRMKETDLCCKRGAVCFGRCCWNYKRENKDPQSDCFQLMAVCFRRSRRMFASRVSRSNTDALELAVVVFSAPVAFKEVVLEGRGAATAVSRVLAAATVG